MYLAPSEHYGAHDFDGGGFYLRGKPRFTERWAVARMTASYNRYIFQNVMLGIVNLAITVAIALFLWNWVWGVGVAYIAIFGVLWFLMIAYGLDEADWIPGDIYTSMANSKLSAKSLGKRRVEVQNSLALRTLVGQYVKGTLEATQDVATTKLWMAAHAKLMPQINALMGDPWVIAAERNLAENAESNEPAVAAKVIDLKGKLRERVWLTTTSLLELEKEEANAEEHRRLSEIDQCLETAPTLPSGQWQQPNKAPKSTDKNLR